MLSSLRQALIFPTETAMPLRVGARGFPDFYALIETPRDASYWVVEDAIKSAGSQLLAASLRRGASGDRVELLRNHINDLRPILLHRPARQSYDEQLALHASEDSSALDFDSWKKTMPQPSRFERATRGIKGRLRYALWEAEYM
jgi:hypothetical protein